MARLSNCLICGQGICDANYCSQECAAAEQDDILYRVRQDLERDGKISESTKQSVLSRKWMPLKTYLKHKKERDFNEGQAALQRQLDEMEEFEVAQDAVRKLQAKRAKR